MSILTNMKKERFLALLGNRIIRQREQLSANNTNKELKLKTVSPRSLTDFSALSLYRFADSPHKVNNNGYLHNLHYRFVTLRSTHSPHKLRMSAIMWNYAKSFTYIAQPLETNSQSRIYKRLYAALDLGCFLFLRDWLKLKGVSFRKPIRAFLKLKLFVFFWA